jgi:hypothetical protein
MSINLKKSCQNSIYWAFGMADDLLCNPPMGSDGPEIQDLSWNEKIEHEFNRAFPKNECSEEEWEMLLMSAKTTFTTFCEKVEESFDDWRRVR